MTPSTATRELLDRLLRERCGSSLAVLIEDVRPQPDEALFWSGSWVEGFANSRSDLDLYLVSADADRRSGVPEVTGPGMPAMHMTITPGRTRVDLTVAPLDLLVAVGGYLDAFDGEGGYPTAWSDSFREFVHRLSIGIPLANESRLTEVRGLVDFAKYRQYLVRHYQNRADSLLEDVHGLLDEGDRVSAYLVARQRLEATADMYLAAHGETNTRVDKWRWKKLTRLAKGDSALLERFLECEAIGQRRQVDVPALTRRCLELGDELILKAV
jgi:hypothetical protein